MKLQRLCVKRFGRFEDFTVDFGDAFNAIVGANDSGKSTLVRAICTALFETPSANRTDTRCINLASKEIPYLVHMEYQAEGKTYHLTKDMATELTLLEEVETGSRWNTPTEVQEQLARAIGFPDKEFYFATSLVRQDDLSGVESAAELIRDKLEKMLNNNKDDLLVSRLLQRIAGRLAQIQGSDTQPIGEISRIDKKVMEWTAELNSSKTKIIELLESRRRQETIGNEIQVTRRLFEDNHDLFRKSKLALEAEQNLNQERETYLDLGRRTKDAQEIQNQTVAKKEELKTMVKIERVDLKSTEALAMQNQLTQSRLEDAEQRLEKENENLRSLEPAGWYRVLVGAALLASVVNVFLWNKLHSALYLGGVGAGVLVAGIAVVLWLTALANFRRAAGKRLEAESRRNEEQEKLDKGTETLQAVLRRFKLDDVASLEEQYERYRDLDRDIKALVTRYESLLGESNLKDLENELGQMTVRISQQQETFNKYKAYATSPEKLELLQRELADLDRRLNQLLEERTTLENKLLYLEAGSDIMAPLQERIEDGERQMTRLREESEILSIVSRYFEEARRRVLKSSIEVLEDAASGLLNTLTEGQWRRVRLDRHTFAAEITPDGDGWIQSSGLSRGTADVLHLALRLALVKIVSVDTRPPIILEDPLLYLDRRRRETALALLRELSEDYQILFFTADELLPEFARHRVTLTADSIEGRQLVAAATV
jgi:DNA repair exonuclease SbcCD ATPase subunit